MARRDNIRSGAIDPDRFARIVELIGRYPDTSRAENDEVIAYMRDGPILDRSQLLNVPAIRDQLDQFQSDHQKQLSIPLRAYVIFVAVVFGVIGLTTWLLWDAGLQ